MVQFESDLWNRMVDKVCIDFTCAICWVKRPCMELEQSIQNHEQRKPFMQICTVGVSDC